MLKSNYTGVLVGATEKAIVQMMLTEHDRSEVQKAMRSCCAMKRTVTQATIDCIKESNSVDEILSFTKLNPSVAVKMMARARIRELSSPKGKSIVVGGHETND